MGLGVCRVLALHALPATIPELPITAIVGKPEVPLFRVGWRPLPRKPHGIFREASVRHGEQV